ncbi:MAG: PAS domain-containing protein, partial [Caldisericota bacterium]|nr:PAS domain-containing protein [Caldisericota bacterium]
MIKVESDTKKSAGDASMVQACAEVFDNIMGSIREPLVVLDADLKVVKANRSFYQIFAIKPDETEGMSIYDLGCRQWNIPEFRRLLEEILPEHAECNDFEVEHTFEILGRKVLHVNARRIHTTPSQIPLILLAIKDVTDREHQKRDLEELVQAR